MFSTVVFPAPLGPTITTNSPLSNENSISFTAVSYTHLAESLYIGFLRYLRWNRAVQILPAEAPYKMCIRDRCFLDTDFAAENNYHVGDTIVFSAEKGEDEETLLKTTQYTVSGIGLSLIHICCFGLTHRKIWRSCRNAAPSCTIIMR